MESRESFRAGSDVGKNSSFAASDCHSKSCLAKITTFRSVISNERRRALNSSFYGQRKPFRDMISGS